MRKIIFHADDIGLTTEITNNIAKHFDVISSVSVIVNGFDLDGAVNSLQGKNIRKVLHLNFMEGKSLSGKSILTDDDGFFVKTFEKLWFFALSKPHRRVEFINAVYNETVAQIEQYKKVFGNYPVSVDSHQHIHMIPFVASGVCCALARFQIEHIRITDEDFSPSTPINMIKWGLLKTLSFYNKSIYEKYNITKQYSFVGVLPTGTANLKLYSRMINKLSGDIEVLFHPGKSSIREQEYWNNRPELFKYYNDTMRDMEAEIMIELHKGIKN